MKYKIVVIADENDGDYITETTDISEEEYNDIYPLLKKVTDRIKLKDVNQNWPESEYSVTTPHELYANELTSDEICEFNEFVPHGEYGIHTLLSVEVIPFVEKSKLL